MAPGPAVGMPSASASVCVALSVWPWRDSPVKPTLPVGASLTLATAGVLLLVALSGVPCWSV